MVDVVGVAVIIVGVLYATAAVAMRYRQESGPDRYRRYRQGLGRAILLGLELLVAADIIRTVAVSPSLESAGVLGIVVLIRTFLSVALQLEIDGRWPWQARPPASEAGSAGDAR